MGIFVTGRRAFAQIGPSLGLDQADGNVSRFSDEPAKTIVDARLSIQAAAELRTFIRSITDIAGGASTLLELDFRTGVGFDEVFHRNGMDVNDVVPSTHEYLIVNVGVMATVSGSFTNLQMARRQLTTVAGNATETLFFADTAASGIVGVRGATGFNSPLLTPLPWYFPLDTVSNQRVFHQLTTSGAGTVNTLFNVLSAPPGTFERIYG